MGHASVKGKDQASFNKSGLSNNSNANKTGKYTGLKGTNNPKQKAGPKESFNRRKMGQKVRYRVKVVDPCIQKSSFTAGDLELSNSFDPLAVEVEAIKAKTFSLEEKDMEDIQQQENQTRDFGQLKW